MSATVTLPTASWTIAVTATRNHYESNKGPARDCTFAPELLRSAVRVRYMLTDSDPSSALRAPRS